MLRAVANMVGGGFAGSFTTLTVTGTSTLGVTRISGVDASSPLFGLSGTTKGLRVVTSAGGVGIDGVDSTLTGSFQPLVLNGSAVTISNSGTPIFTTSSAGAALTGFLEQAEQTAPSAPAANGVRLYAQDNGAGKTQLMALFSSGAAQQIAIQP